MGTLVGRAEELARIDAALGRLAAGEAAAIEFVGEPGIGKTALLDRLQSSAAAGDLLVLSGGAAQFERGLPFGVLVDALDDYLAGLNPRLFDALSKDEQAELGRVFPALGELAEDRVSALETERHRAHRAVRSLLERLAARKPVVLALDDIHWADDASHELISFLLRRRPRGPVLLALAYRRGQASPRLRAALDRAIRGGALESVEVGPLSEADSQQLVGTRPASGVAHALYRESGGNPFYLEQLTRALASGSRPISVAEADGPGDAPRAVLASLAQEITELDGPARALLRGGAVIGDPFELDLAIDAAQLDEREALAALDGLLARELLRETRYPRRFRFRHPIVRRAVYDAAPTGFRLAAHARAADALAAGGAPAIQRARHVEHSAQPGDSAAIALLETAAHAATRRAPAAAAHWFAAALRLLPAGKPETGRRLQLLIPRATALAASGDLRESRAILLESLSLVPEGATAERVQLVAVCASVESLLGLHESAGRRLSNALSDVSKANSPEAASLLLALASQAMYSGEYDGVRAAALKARRVAQEARNVMAATSATGLLALVECSSGDPASALGHVDEAAALLASLTDERLAEQIDAPYWVGWAQLFTDRLGDSRRSFERALEISRATSQGYLVVPILVGKTNALVALGRLRESVEAADEAIEAARLGGAREMLGWALSAACWSASRAGDVERGLGLADEAMELVIGLEPSAMTGAVGWTAGAARLEAGDAEGCASCVLEQGGGPTLERVEPYCRAISFELLVQSELARGKVEEARGWTDRVEQLSRDFPLPVPVALARRARAEVELAAGQPATAAELALEAAASADRVEARLDAARARLVAGRALAAAGDPDGGGALLAAAHAELGQAGATRWRDQAARELRKLGRRPQPAGSRRTSGTGVPSLSPREREVARLVSQGRSNKEIASALFLSVRTVENHLRRIFTKLDVSRRGAIGALLVEEGDEA